MSAEVIGAARALRLAQRAYMADRGNDELGAEVGAAAAALDAALDGREPPARPSVQTRRGSALEAALNVLIGIAVAAIGNALFLPLVGLPAPDAGQHVALAALFTALSLARSYAVRRLFNRLGV